MEMVYQILVSVLAGVVVAMAMAALNSKVAYVARREAWAYRQAAAQRLRLVLERSSDELNEEAKEFGTMLLNVAEDDSWFENAATFRVRQMTSPDADEIEQGTSDEAAPEWFVEHFYLPSQYLDTACMLSRPQTRRIVLNTLSRLSAPASQKNRFRFVGLRINRDFRPPLVIGHTPDWMATAFRAYPV